MWACGTVLFALLTKTLPFEDDAESDPLFLLLDKDPVQFWDDIASRFAGRKMSSTVVDLMTGMLAPDPARRLTAEAALAHPFFA